MIYDDIWKRKLQNEGKIPIRVAKAAELIKGGEKLLDVGCGSGVISTVASDRYSMIYGLDISKRAVESASKMGIVARAYDINKKLPYKNEFFDAITCLDAIDYIQDPRDLVKEFYRVLKPNGIVIISFPNIRNWRKILSLIRGHFPKTSGDLEGWDGGHIRYFTSRDIMELLKKNGLETILILGLYDKKIPFSNRAFMREFVSGGIIIKAVKL